MKNPKAKLAATATVVALGGLTGLALSQGVKAPEKQLADKPVVHTKVIRRTVHVTKHAKPKHPPIGAGGSYAAPATGSYGSATTGASSSGSSSGSYSSEPVSTSSSGSPSPAGSGSGGAPVTTHTSGAGSSGGGESAPVSTGASGAASTGGGEVEHESEFESEPAHESEGGDD
ncbi:MAG TPA: hypothetical protein VFU16_02890 [Solirubrobacterales bacterium]|nr:hypothetical protein [Solirubrobacterales bacterium]